MFEKLKKWIFGEQYGSTIGAKRIYLFPLPYKILAVYLVYGMKQLKAEGIFQKLPKDLQQKWVKAASHWHDIRVTSEDLDRIDDSSWSKIAKKLKLEWRTK